MSIGATMIMSGCGNNNNETVSISDVKELAEKTEDAMEESTKRQEARKAKGDTIAMPYNTLQTYLPSIGGYNKEGGPEGNQMNMPGMGSWSQVSQTYSVGNKNINVTLFDYNGALTAFTGATALYSMGFSQENDQTKSGSVDLGIPGVSAYETIYKQEQRAELILMVVDRFFVQMNLEGSNDVNLLKDAAKSMNLKDLTSR